MEITDQRPAGGPNTSSASGVDPFRKRYRIPPEDNSPNLIPGVDETGRILECADGSVTDGLGGRNGLNPRPGGPQPDGTAFTKPEQLGLANLLLNAVGDNSQQLERALGRLQEKPTDLERYVYLIRLCDRNEPLFYKVLMSDRIRFLLASDDRRRLLEIGPLLHRSRRTHVTRRVPVLTV
jgi:hypothetical protein